MVLGLIDFLLGGGKKKKVARNAQIKTGTAQPVNNHHDSNNLPDGVNNTTENSKGQPQEQNSNVTQQRQSPTPSSSSPSQKKSVAEALSKFHAELKSTNSRISDLVTSIKNVENNVNSLGHRVDEIESSNKEFNEKFEQVEANMAKFLSLYELINNQYNPFVVEESKEKVEILSDGNTSQSNEDVSKKIEDLPNPMEKKTKANNEKEDLETTLCELDTINIEEAAGNAVPLTMLKNNTNSLVMILSWLEYLIKKVGIEETRNTLRYYTEVLRWITPEVYFDLDKYLRGMKDKKDVKEGDSLSVRDHIVSLYFISKLNKKSLDEKLTKAVLQIIKN